MYKKGLMIRKISLIPKIITSKTGKQTIVMPVFPNISRSKSNQTTKSGQLIAYNMKKIFPEKPCTKCGGEINPKPFSKK